MNIDHISKLRSDTQYSSPYDDELYIACPSFADRAAVELVSILVPDDEDYNRIRDFAFKGDPEENVVHEAVHKLAAQDRDILQRIAIESRLPPIDLFT